VASKPTPAVEQPIIAASDVDLKLDILLTDTGNARRVREEYGDECRFCLEEKVWYVWNPELGVWKRDPEEIQMQWRAKLTFQKLRNEQRARVEELEPQLQPFRDKLTKKLECRADETLEPEQAQTLANYVAARSLEAWYENSENADKLNKAITMLRSEPGMTIHSSLFDRDPYLFNCLSGTFDLRESTIVREHRRTDFCTMLAPVEADPFADPNDAPLFTAFINRIMPDEDVRVYLQRFCGLCLSGLADERAILLFLGTGANGKGTLVRILCSVLGEDGGYAAMAAMNSFLQTKYSASDETRNDLVALIGKRFVAVSETNKKAPPLNSALLKCFAGGDGNLRIRGNWESLRNFTPKGKLVLATNNEPKIDDDSQGMWSRIKKVWFDVCIPDAEQDKDLVTKIMAKEAPAVLAWFLQGWAAYWEARQQGRPGLPTPKRIEQDTDEYRDSQSQIALFVDTCCVLDPSDGYCVLTRELYTAYKQWAEAAGERNKMSERAFSIELENWGSRHGVCKGKRVCAGIPWHGLRLRDAAVNPADGALQYEGDPDAM
jgi:putative DNA primase/helicase